MLINSAPANELPDESVFRIRIQNFNSYVTLKSAGWFLGRRKDLLERCQSSEDGIFVALVY